MPSMKHLPFVSIIMPCRNEVGHIKECLQSIVAQDYPKELMEFLISDGMSEDGTREIIKSYTQTYPCITLLDNQKRYTPSALNIAIKESKGSVILRIDSHAKYENDYISKCVKYLEEYQADNIGGTMKTVPAKDTLTAKSIAFCMGHSFGVGNSYFRKGSPKSRNVDTVFGGCYKKEVFNKIGLFNENLIRSQDLDFNLRLKKAGGKIVLIPDIVSYYYPKPTFKEFLLHNFIDGQWAILPLKFTGTMFKLRHYVPLMGMLLLFLLLLLSFFWPMAFVALLIVLGLYVVALASFSLAIVLREKNFKYIFFMPIAFFIRNFGYGLGEVYGLCKLLV